MKNLTLLTILLVTSLFNSYCQISAPTIQWQNTIGGNEGDYLYSIQQTTNGGYILGGDSYSGISGDKTSSKKGNSDYWVLKVSSTGNILQQKTFGGNSGDYLSAVYQTTDGGYILGGYSSSGISGNKTEASQGTYDYWVLKLSAAGAIEWQNAIGGANADYLQSIQQTTDGGYILGGYSYSGISGDKTEASQGGTDYWVVKLSATGTIQWQNTIGGSSGDMLKSIQQTTDGGYILGGYSSSGISGDKTEANQGLSDYWVVKLATNGVIQWQNTIGGSDDDYLLSLQQTTDGGYILGGYSKSVVSGDKTDIGKGGNDYWVVKLAANGNIQQQKTIGGYNDDILISVQQTIDGGYILGGYSSSGISGDKTEASQGFTDYWVVKLSATATIEWQNTIGGSSSEGLQSIQQTTDGGYILGGYSVSGISGDKTEICQGYADYWVVKLSNPNANKNEINPLMLYPNPAQNYVRISHTGTISVQIYSMMGQLVSTQILIENEDEINISNFSSGVYLVQITDSEYHTQMQYLIK
jgi:hypothetical protein